MTRVTAFKRLNDAKGEWSAASLALERLVRHVAADASVVRESQHVLRPSMVRESFRHIEITFILRIYAEFEGILRDYWNAVRQRERRTPMEVLVERIGALRHISSDVLQSVHDVRDLRNAIVHHRPRQAGISLVECEARLASLGAWLPLEW
jgi:hypothetical protein